MYFDVDCYLFIYCYLLFFIYLFIYLLLFTVIYLFIYCYLLLFIYLFIYCYLLLFIYLFIVIYCYLFIYLFIVIYVIYLLIYIKNLWDIKKSNPIYLKYFTFNLIFQVDWYYFILYYFIFFLLFHKETIEILYNSIDIYNTIIEKRKHTKIYYYVNIKTIIITFIKTNLNQYLYIYI